MTVRFIAGIWILLLVPGVLMAQDDEIGGRHGAASDSPPGPPPFVAMLGAGAGYGFSLADDSRSSNGGMLFAGDLRLAIGPKKYVVLRQRNQTHDQGTWVFDDRFNDRFYEAEFGSTLRQYLLMIGHLMSPEVGQRICGYWEFGLGYGRGESWSKYTTGGSRSVSVDHLGLLAAQVGVMIPFAHDSNLGLDISGSMVLQFVSDDGFVLFGDGEKVLFGLQAGLYLALGRP